MEIENARLPAARDERRYQVPPDEAAAAGDEHMSWILLHVALALVR